MLYVYEHDLCCYAHRLQATRAWAALHTLSKLITVCPVPVLALPQHTFDKVQVHEKSEVAAAATPCSASLASSHVVSAVSLCQAQQWVCNPSPV